MFAEVVRQALSTARPQAPDDLTERILDAALAQFVDHGLRRSTMEDVARRAGLARATVYRRFPGKEVLLEAVALREVRRFFDGVAEVRSQAASAEERVVETGAFSMRFLRGHPLIRRLIDTEPESIVSRLTVDGDALLTTARELTIVMITDEVHGPGPVPPGLARDIEMIAEVFVRLTLSFILNDRGAIPMATNDDAREFGRRFVAPLYTSLTTRSQSNPSR